MVGTNLRASPDAACKFGHVTSRGTVVSASVVFCDAPPQVASPAPISNTDLGNNC